MSWKVQNIGKRDFISKPEDFLKGGTPNAEKTMKHLTPNSSAEVSDKFGEILATYSDIRIIKRPGQKKEE